ncbi:MAG: SDR family oxidoreductase [Acidobacteriota bacterium]|jgi:NAD(P)-dependent dehydrogenase (short-subunit alcohol dehydrogenase family)
MTSAYRGAVLITGASTGIGEATALHLDARGFEVFAGVRSEEDARRLSEQASGALRPVFLDVTEEGSIEEALEIVREALGERHGGLAGLVNNAGIVVAGPLEMLPPEAVRRQLEVNVIGLHAVTRAFLPLLREGCREGPGRIVNVSSANGRVATRWTGAYAASKFAVEALSDALRMELRPWKIPVSVIQPGVIDTPVWKRSFDRATRILGEVDEDRRRLYEQTLERLERREGRTPPHAVPPVRVAETIERALTARRPKTRYLVAREAWFAALVAHLPDRLRDRILSS